MASSALPLVPRHPARDSDDAQDMVGWECLDMSETGLAQVGALKLGDQASKVLVSALARTAMAMRRITNGTGDL